MRKTIVTIILLKFLMGQTFGQVDSVSIYKNLKIKKVYTVDLSSFGDGRYEVNGKPVSKKTYEKYASYRDDFSSCCPCILRYYDENDLLIREAVSCTDCGVGSFKEYYPNGQVRVSGQYKENPTGNWDSIYYLGYCNVQVGQWHYFNEKGELLYSEFWDNGNFIKQIPEQSKTEIWKVESTLNGESVKNSTLTSAQFKQLEITPKFKNSSRDSVNLSFMVDFFATRRVFVEKPFPMDEFKEIDLDKLLSENGFKSNDKITCGLSVINNDKRIDYFMFNVMANLPESNEPIEIPKTIDSSKIIAHNTDFFLVNSVDTTKRVKLNYQISTNLNYSERNSDSLIDHKTYNMQGFIVNLTNASLNYDIASESIIVKYSNGVESTINTEYLSTDYSGDDNLRSISLNKLNYIDYSSPKRSFCYSLAGTTTFLAVLTTFVVAPLVSINFQNGDFNKKRYYAVAGSGLIGLSVGIPMMLLSSPKRYHLTEININKGKNRWYLESKRYQ